MFVLQIPNTEPAMYIAVSDGFIEKVDTTSQAFQMARQQDAQALQQLVVDGTVVVSV